MDDKLKTSAEWQKLYPEIEVYDPDGWDRTNYHYSWYEQLISEKEYFTRIVTSTCSFHDGFERLINLIPKSISREQP